jgi:hypothetical protein
LKSSELDTANVQLVHMDWDSDSQSNHGISPVYKDTSEMNSNQRSTLQMRLPAFLRTTAGKSMRRKNAASSIEEPDRDLLNHISSLGIASVEEYRDWCARNGFSRKLNKHWKQRCRERSFTQQAVAQERLKRNHADILHAVCRAECQSVMLPSVCRKANSP